MKACQHLMERLGHKPSRKNKKMGAQLIHSRPVEAWSRRPTRMSMIGMLVLGVMIRVVGDKIQGARHWRPLLGLVCLPPSDARYD